MYHYIIRDFHTGMRLGKFSNEKQAQAVAHKFVKRFGTYLTVSCFDNTSKSHLQNFVFSDNACNYDGKERIGN